MSHRRIQIGLYGAGRWSHVLQNKIKALSDICEVVYIANSKETRLDKQSLASIDWAFVASPPETHYEIVDSCLRAGINVFCEKPLSTSPSEVRRLYKLAHDMHVCLYVDDVFLWRDQFKRLDTHAKKKELIWEKTGEEKVSGLRLAKDLAYHHIYMLGKVLNFPKVSCIVHEFTESLKFDLILDDKQKFSMFYLKSASKDSHTVLGTDFSKTTNDALLEMLRYVLQLKETPAENKKLVIWTTHVLRTIISSRPEKIAVVGGGIFGCTAALDLAKNGYDVTIFEAGTNIIQGATLKNQLRIHRGYHYPRSDETALQCLASEHKFYAYFKPSIDSSVQHYYAIALHNSKVTASQYEEFMSRHNLEYTRINNKDIQSPLRDNAIAAVYAVQEFSYNPNKLRDYLLQRCNEEGVKFKFGKRIKNKDELVKNFDRRIFATYAEPVISTRMMQFEVCEKPIVKLPSRFKGLSMVIMDGPFVSLDPYSNDNSLHLIGSVTDAIHHTNVGLRPEIPENIASYLNGELIKNPSITKIASFRRRFASLYNIAADEIDHIGSYFVIRAVEADREKDDRRISELQEIEDNIYNIYSAKVGSAPLISQKLVRRFENFPL